ncbi:nicotinamide riboside transporter PnuC [Massilia sp. CF038]|uniref:nicotinamide riboside transporter PnuC n=1 Tax=Massilia sp. CF038 TaxID=1881045 RepID=UPI00091660E0|nr:nicotinamide riboside transporter PnuC [Massilia sp. CF038]SHG57450.1 nicotinamide mononucleotide transporter [Massilia sp. CF038]
MNDPITLIGITTTYLELISFILAVITVALNIRQLHWAWLFSIASSATYAVVFYDARLYGDMGLQFVFISVSVWGWYQWLRGGVDHAPLPVTASSAKGWAWGIAAWLAAFALLAWFLAKFTNTDVPNTDGFLTAGSLLGQVLLSRKKVENWIVWIVVDILYVGLYMYKGLHLTAVLYGIFVIMAVMGWVTWYRAAGSKHA